jgi:hypothetical protein
VGAPSGDSVAATTQAPVSAAQAPAERPPTAESSPLYRRLLGPAALVIAGLALAITAWRSGSHSKTNELASKESQS